MRMEREKQGRLGDLEKMTLPQLQELLDRQEKLLSRQRFLQTLPDRGQKVKDFAVKLQNMIAYRQKGCLAQKHTQLGLSQASAALTGNRQTTSCPVRSIPSVRNGDSSLPESNTESQGDGEVMDSTVSLSDAIDSLVISELTAPRMIDKYRSTDGGSLEIKFPNSYEVVMKKNQTTEIQRERFKPNRSLKISDIHQLPDAYKCKSRTSASVTHSSATVDKSAESNRIIDQSVDGKRLVDQSADSSRTVDQSADSSGRVNPSAGSTVAGRKKGASVMMPEDSAVPGPRYKFQGAKEVSLQESMMLQRQQQEQLQKLQTLHAAERLAERLSIKTVDYDPPALDMQYRSNSAADDRDASDSDDDDDAPD